MASTAPVAPPFASGGVRAEIGEIGAIEGMRGIAVAWVVLFHYCAVRPHDDPWNRFVASWPVLQRVAASGYLGVDLFFLVTSFLLVLPWERHRRLGLPPPDAPAFYRRRIRRIAPAYYVHLALLFFVFLPLLWSVDSWRRDTALIATNLAAHAAFVHYLTPVTSGSLNINGALWTLAIEAQYYLALPLFAAAYVRAPLRATLAFIAAACAWRWAAHTDLAPLVAVEMSLGRPWHATEGAVRQLLATQLPGFLAHFALGIALGLAWMDARGRTLARGERAASVALALVAAFAVMALAAGWLAMDPSCAWLLVPALMVALLQWLLVAMPRAGDRVLAGAVPRALGRISYSMYLYHLPLMYLWNRAHVLEGHAASMPACLLAIAGLSVLSYRFVERPFLRARRSTAPLGVTVAA